MTNVTWKKYKTWSGCLVPGTAEYELKNDKKSHIHRALWLTAQVEGGGKFGAINSYDGAGISAGLEHKIALYPKTLEQGSLWKLLREMEVYSPCEQLSSLWNELKVGPKWYISQDGKLRRYTNGTIISGTEIRNVLAPPGGKVPTSGPRWDEAKKWAILFHELFAAEETFKVQINSAITSLVESNKKVEQEAYDASVGVLHPSALTVEENINLEFDLAWCVYHSFSVNAPSKARAVLVSTAPDKKATYPKKLIKALGTDSYGNWKAIRYGRTRKYAMNSGLWPETFFVGSKAIMPEKL